MRKIVVACDSFKGCLSSAEIAGICAESITDVFPGCKVVGIAVGDGGEGTVDSLVTEMNGSWETVTVKGPLFNDVEARYGIVRDKSTAIMEMSAASGITLIDPSLRNPEKTTSYGTGEMILDAIRKGCREILLGIGGSATNDGGMGMLAALGFRFLDINGNELEPIGGNLRFISHIDNSNVNSEVLSTKFIVACDVDNPLCGYNGASAVFGPQKGADPEMVKRLDTGLRNYAEILKKEGYGDIADLPGAGAAGGMGGGLSACLNAVLKPGIEMVLDAIDFDNKITGADLVFTGEGKIDSQSLSGKTPYGILKRGVAQSIPVIAIGGAVEDSHKLNEAGFTAIFPIQSSPISLTDAMQPAVARKNIKRTVTQILLTIKRFTSN